MKTKKLSLVLLILVGSLGLFSFIITDEPLTKLIIGFDKYFEENTQEKIYLHTDKPFYAVGDDIWFKAYVLDAKNLKPTAKSNVLYVELIDAKDSVQKRVRLPLVAGLGWGNFELKDSVGEGNYRIRAYTNWMRNYDSSFFYDKTFKIGNAWTSQLITKASYNFTKDGNDEKVSSKINFSNLDGYAYANKVVSYTVVFDGAVLSKGKSKTDEKGDITLDFVNTKPFLASNGRINVSIKLAEGTVVEKTIPIKNTSNDVDLQFFPEGGYQVANVRSGVAFKAVGADGLGKSVSGFVQDEAGQKVALIKSKHLGMGMFSFVPTTGKTYQALVKFEDGLEKSFTLPAIKPEGAVLGVSNLGGDTVFVKVAVNAAYLEKNLNKQITVIAQNNGNILYTAKTKLSSLSFAAELGRKRFLAGINQITLFDEDLQPLAERLIFIAPDNQDTLKIGVKPDKKVFIQRSKTSLAIQALNPEGEPVRGTFSMSVVDAGKVNTPINEEENIFTNLLLTSDLKGYIENPNYYFNKDNDDRLLAADLLMLTQGWRRFNWQNLSIGRQFAFKPEKTLSISGRVTQGKDKPVENGTVTIFSSGKNPLLIQTKTNALGEFMVDSLYFLDSTRFVVQARNEKGKKGVDIEIYNNSFPVVSKNNSENLTVNINDSMAAYLKNSKSQYEEWLKNGIVNRSILLGEVVVVDKKPEVENSNNLNGAGNADRVLTEKDFVNAFSVEQALQGRVAGLIMQNGIALIRGQQAQIILDGILVESAFLNSIPIQDVESIEILKTIAYTAIYGGRGGGGVIIINTKRGKPGYVSNIYVPGIVTYRPIGLLKEKEFYVPNYAEPKINASVADLRTTVYWNPNIITDSLGNANVSFYNGDNTGTYRIVLEGTDLKGHIARTVTNYTLIQNR